MEKRFIGIDLHRNQFTCCIRLENERTYVSEWKLADLAKWIKKLRPSDEVAVEITGNTRLFYDAVAPHVARVVVVDTNQFRIISRSVKKTDPHDARALSVGEKSERIFGSLVTGNYFETLGLRPVLGRFFGPEEDRVPGANPIAVMGYTSWQQRFGGTSDIVGRNIRLNDMVVTIVGVAPEGFKGITAVFGPDLWVPATMAEEFLPRHTRFSTGSADVQTRNALRERGERLFHAAARLKPSVSMAEADANMKAIAAALARSYPELNQTHTVALRPLTEAAFGNDAARVLWERHSHGSRGSRAADCLLQRGQSAPRSRG